MTDAATDLVAWHEALASVNADVETFIWRDERVTEDWRGNEIAVGNAPLYIRWSVAGVVRELLAYWLQPKVMNAPPRPLACIRAWTATVIRGWVPYGPRSLVRVVRLTPRGLVEAEHCLATPSEDSIARDVAFTKRWEGAVKALAHERRVPPAIVKRLQSELVK